MTPIRKSLPQIGERRWRRSGKQSGIFFAHRETEISKAVYITTKTKAPIPPEMNRRIQRVRLAQEFPGWTLEYIDNLDPFDLADIWGVLDGQQKAQKGKS